MLLHTRVTITIPIATAITFTFTITIAGMNHWCRVRRSRTRWRKFVTIWALSVSCGVRRNPARWRGSGTGSAGSTSATESRCRPLQRLRVDHLQIRRQQPARCAPYPTDRIDAQSYFRFDQRKVLHKRLTITNMPQSCWM